MLNRKPEMPTCYTKSVCSFVPDPRDLENKTVVTGQRADERGDRCPNASSLTLPTPCDRSRWIINFAAGNLPEERDSGLSQLRPTQWWGSESNCGNWLPGKGPPPRVPKYCLFTKREFRDPQLRKIPIRVLLCLGHWKHTELKVYK